MALDHGTKKIGIAFCDALEILASPFEVWPMEGDATIERLGKLAKSECAEALLVGMPCHKDGTPSATAPLAQAFGEALAARTGLPLRFTDEHLTSAEAERLLAQRGVKAKDRKAKLDAASAAVLLQGHLEERSSHAMPRDQA